MEIKHVTNCDLGLHEYCAKLIVFFKLTNINRILQEQRKIILYLYYYLY